MSLVTNVVSRIWKARFKLSEEDPLADFTLRRANDYLIFRKEHFRETSPYFMLAVVQDSRLFLYIDRIPCAQTSEGNLTKDTI